MNKKVLLLGGGGFIGVNLIEKFLNHEYEIFVYGRTQPSVFGKTIHFIDAEMSDIEEHKDYLKDLRIDTAIYLINTFPVNLKSAGYNSLLIQNKSFITEIIDIVDRFIFFSSGGRVYKSSGQPHHEDEQLFASCDYGRSKIELEQFVAAESKVKRKSFLIIRPSNPYGPHQSLAGNQGLIAVLIGRILDGAVIDVWGTGHEVRDYIYIKDFVDIFYELYKIKYPKYNVYNIGSGVGVSTLTILDAVKKQLSINDVMIEYLPCDNIVKSNILCNNRICAEVGIMTRTSLNSGIAQFVDWLENKKL